MQLQAIGRHYGPLTTTATPAPLVSSERPWQHTSQPIKCPRLRCIEAAVDVLDDGFWDRQ